MAANLYEKELTKLIRNLSIHECSKTLRDKVGNSPEPYRVFLRPIRDKMKNNQRLIQLNLNNKKFLKQSSIMLASLLKNNKMCLKTTFKRIPRIPTLFLSKIFLQTS